MDFQNRIGKLKRDAIFKLDGYYVWCGTMTCADDGLYYLYFSFWEEALGFNAWVTNSKIGYAVGSDPFGRFEYRGIALDARGGGFWDGDCVHNPAVIKHGGKYYLYYMGNYGCGEYWDNRNHQRIGVAVADNPAGPWKRFDTPLIDTSPGGHDSLMTSNPSVAVTDDGKFVMIYKAVENNGKLPKGGAVVCGIATSDSPTGPFIKSPYPVMVNPENEWSVEDAFIWFEGGRFYSLAKDFHGYFTGAGENHIALFESDDALDWKLSEGRIGYLRGLATEDGDKIELHYMERPQIYLKDGKPFALLCACMTEADFANSRRSSFNVRLKLD